MSLLPEQWEMAGTAVEDGLSVVYVARETWDMERRLVLWKLVRFPGKGWRSVGQFISTKRFRIFPEEYGVKLTDSRIDQILLSFCLRAEAEGRFV